MTVVCAFNLEQAARLAHVSERQASYWAHRGVLHPSILFDRNRRPTRYLYSFEDVVGLRVIGLLRNHYGLSLQMLRKAGNQLRQVADRPWSKLTFWVRGKDLFFSDPDRGGLISTDGRQQATARIEIERVASDVEREAKELARRKPEEIGQIERRRNVLGNQLVISGTRVPVSAILSMARTGHSEAQIVDAYPTLTREDVRAILSFNSVAAA
ncbi:hypothetical protein BH24CHL4_BH24CHL4_22520 [soil metagenome]